MLKRLTRGARFWAAIALIAGYVLCVLAPSAALAFSPAPCHADGHHAPVSAQAQAHQDGAAHDHDPMGGDGSPAGDDAAAVKCCGLASVTAIAPQTELDISLPVDFARTALVVAQGLAGVPPEGLKRPPKV